MTKTEAYSKGYLKTSSFDDKPMLTWEGNHYVSQCGGSCDTCPFKDLCSEYELHWGCRVWEDEMGEDLQKLNNN